MAEPDVGRKELMDEMLTRKKLGDKKFHSETSLQNYGEDEDVTPTVKDPGVQNPSINGNTSSDEIARRRTVSQPGPVSGSLLTATAARAARKKNVNYAPSDLDRLSSKITVGGDDSGTATPTGERLSPFPPPLNGSFHRNPDLKSLSNYRQYASASATPRKRSVATMDAQSLRSVETHAPPPTSPEDNIKQTKKYISLVVSCIYATLLVTLGLIIYISDSLINFYFSIGTVYSLILAFLGFLYHMYLMIDIQRYKNVALYNQRIKNEYEDKIAEYFRKQEELYGDNNYPFGDGTPDAYKNTAFPAPTLKPLRHKYCFSQGRHSGSFYLKLGAAAFALGNLVHSILLIAVQIGYLVDENIDNDLCVDYVRVALDVFQPFYCFLQLFFVFKYSNVIILRAQGLAHFGFMHLIGSSLCFWITAIIRETILALTIYAQYTYGGSDYDIYAATTSNSTLLSSNIARLEGDSASRFINISGLYDENCMASEAISAIYENFSPYLYPFSVEFNILIVAVYYIIWSNIGHCPNEDDGGNSEFNTSVENGMSVCKIPTANEDNDFTSNMVISADCHASNKGLFLGMGVIIALIAMLILGFVFSTVGGDYLELGYVLNDYTKLSLHSIMLFGSILAFTQTKKLDINEHPISLLDDILLFVCLPPFFMETVFSLVATITILNIVKSIDFSVMVVQVLIQTPLIMDGLRRCSNSRKLRRKKPAREIIMFLLIANVGMWLFYTFSYKSPDSLDERYTYYGKVLWTILGHVSLPLIMFYRFHSSVCFADIWNSAYKPGSEH